MDQPEPRKPIFTCLICLNSTYYPEIEIDYGKYGKRKLKVCGECMRDREKAGFIVHHAVEYLLGDIPRDVVTAKVYEVLAEYHEPPRQGS